MTDAGQEAPDPLDLRLLPVALALWAGALVGTSMPWRPGLAGCGVAAVVGSALAGRLPSADVRRALAAAVLCLLAGFAVGAARAAPVWDGPVGDLADVGAYVEIDGVMTRDPSIRSGPSAGPEGGDAAYVVSRVRVEQITGRGRTYQVRVPVLLVAGDPAWAGLLPGQRVHLDGRLAASEDPRDDVAAVFRPRAGPGEASPPSLSSRMTEPLREGLRRSVAGAGEDARGLVPGLVIGDESLLSDELRADMLTTGLSHLTAVSGSNVAVILVVVLGLARRLGARGYVLPVLATLGVAGFVLLARPDPSVLRAAAMGMVAVVGLMVAGRRRGLPALATAVGALVLVDPWLARSAGFVLSVLATAGILLLVPTWQRALSWLPRPLAVALVVPLAAQVACTPVLISMSDELSLASLPANMLAAPAVAPATVLGVVAAVVSPLLPPVASVAGWLAGLPAWWIAVVARWFADQPGAVVAWPPGVAGVAVSVVLAMIAVLAMPAVLRQPIISIAAATLLAIGVLKAIPTPGWPPPGWLVVACDVGQGDAVVLRAAANTAVVVDAGPQPRAVRRCLDSLDVEHVPLLVLTHFHTDHVAGLAGVLAGREVDRVLVSPLTEPAEQAEDVTHQLRDAGVPVDVARAGERGTVGTALQFEVLWPRRLIESPESDANNASVVIAADVQGTDVLLTGDLEPTAQRALLRAEPDLTTDILKVAHHGSPNQERELLTGLGARLALVSVGDNTYGHPSPRVLDALHAGGARAVRTDRDGSIAVVRTRDGELGVATGGPRVRVRRRIRRCRVVGEEYVGAACHAVP